MGIQNAGGECMKLITGKQLLGFMDSYAKLGQITRDISAICATRYGCPNGHEIDGGNMLLDQKLCLVCNEPLDPIGPVENQKTER